ncbi:MAG: 1,4-dihydroxy-2-naphthoate polyprenyltransferase [Ignavibacteriaceae bacterium]|nr:1,4-dihydroxy-2-naphthoate polyprenyltransferase [Ignavibacteriaceae bacterium]
MQNKITKSESWILASRPKTLLAAVVPVMVGSALAVSENKFKLPVAIAAFLCTVLIQIGTNFINDLYDFFSGADNEKRKGPQRVLVSGLITPAEMKAGIIITFLVAFFIGLYLVSVGGIIILFVGVVSILAGIAYTAGPYPLAYHGLGDIFVFIFFGVVGTVFTHYIHTGELSTVAFWSSLPVGALITNILVINNYRDFEEDKDANKNTLVVILGRTFARYQYVFMIVLSFAIPLILFFIFKVTAWIFLPYLTLPLAYKLIKMIYTLHGTELNKTLELTAKLSALYGLLFSFGLVF